MAIDPRHVRRILTDAQRPVGVKELLRLAGYGPGQQTDLKRTLRELLRGGEVLKEGKRFLVPQPRGRAAPAPAPAAVAPEGEAPAGWRPGRGAPPGRRPGAAPGRAAAGRAPLRGEAPRAGRGRPAHAEQAPSARRPEAEGPRRGFREAEGARRGFREAEGPRRGFREPAGARLERERTAQPGGRFGEGRAQGKAGRGRAAEARGPERGARGRRFETREVEAREAWRPRGGRREPTGPGQVQEGVLHIHRDGFGFVHPLGAKGENIFLPAFEAQRALDKDLVRVMVRGPEGRREGRLIEVVERRRQMVVGVYRHRGRRSHVEPYDVKLGDVIRVPPTQIARDGDVVKVRLGVGSGLVDMEGGLYGEVAGSMGRPGHPSGEVLSIAFAQGFSDEFPAEVMDEADAVPLTVSPVEWMREGRRDLRQMPLVTIDGEDARDFDDAVYAEPDGQGWRLVVAIADVTHYVREGTALNAEALRRATSVYLPDRVLPMLPERLSNGICSLRPDEDRMCMVADILLDRDGKRLSAELYPAVMRSAARCTYNEVQAVLDGQDVPHRNAFRPHFERLETVARTLRRMRERRGAIDFDLDETKVQVGEDGYPEKVVKRERLFAHRLIEECMLAANEAVAHFFHELGLPTVYRFHGEPDEEKLRAFMTLAQAYGFTFAVSEDVPTSAELNAFVQSLQGHPEQRALNQLLLRSMMQAVYSSENVGHYGLAAEHYLHFTSPIRRYPDLLVHRLLKAHWERKGRKRIAAQLEQETERLESMAVHSSERERAAMQAEREVSQYYVCLLMKDRVGEEFEGTVAGVADFGFFVELAGENVEGLVRAETVAAGAQLDPVLHALVFPNGRRVRVGDKVRVQLASINMERRQLELAALAFHEERRKVEAVGPRVRRRRAAEAEAPAAAGKGPRRKRAAAEAPVAGEAPARARKAPARKKAAATAPTVEAAGVAYTPSKRVMRKRPGAKKASAPAEVEAPKPAHKGAKHKTAETKATAPAGRPTRAHAARAPRVDPDAELRASPEAALRAQSESESPENYGARPAFVIPGMEEPEPQPRSSVHPGFDRLRSLASLAGKGQPAGKGQKGRKR